MASHEEAVKNTVDALIRENTVIIFSRTTCPFCGSTKELLDRYNIPYRAIELDLVENGQDVLAYLLELTGQHTVPNIFINGKHIGGFSELEAGFRDGTVQKLLAEAKAEAKAEAAAR
ncbi:hypothetical protein EV182_003642 [Spiromyces aspiralis]|uniref:Uncharacterized protein n=1 Tax=Spiromyces aspiralis TaxID=68401 RepID=A0ACC1HXM6_9FUNG|nr:hypothetical protein EV182_003642 [Spiromyces aspiralis]